MGLFQRVRLIKFNPNHDERGRFASGGSSGVKVTDTASLLRSSLKKEGGFTYSVVNGSSPKPGDTAFSVSAYPDREQILDLKDVTPAKLAAYVHKNLDLLRTPGNFFGAWHDTGTGKVFLDTVIVVDSLDKAKEIGKTHNQIAAFDFKTMSTVDIVPERRDTIGKGGEDMADNKPVNRLLISGESAKTREGVLELFKSLTGRDATEAEIADMDAELARLNEHTPKQS